MIQTPNNGVCARGLKLAREQPGRPHHGKLEPQFEALEPGDFAVDKDIAAPTPACANKPAIVETPRLGAENIDEIVFLALLAGLALAPFSFVSNNSFGWRELAIFFAAFAVLYEIGLLISARRRPVAARRLWLPALAFTLVCARMLARLDPAFSIGDREPILRMALTMLGLDSHGLKPDEAILALLRLVACALAFWISLQLCRSSARARRLVEAIVIIEVLYACYGIVGFYIYSNAIFLFDKSLYRDSMTSAVIDRDAYAAYAGIGLTAAVALAMRLYITRHEFVTSSRSRKTAALIAMTVGAGGAWFACAIVIATGLCLTGSHSGFIATVAAIIALALLLGIRGRPNAVAMGFGALGAMLAIAGIFFNWSVAIFRRPSSNYWDETNRHFGDWSGADNGYLELFQGLGGPFATIFIAGLGALAGRCFYAALTRRRSVIAPLAANAATVIVWHHTFVDFSVQNSAVALTWAALLGAAVAQSWSSGTATEC